MTSDATFLHIETAAHGGAFGHNQIPEPTEAQCQAGNYKMGRVSLYGLPIAIEQPRGTYRTGVDAKTGKRWSSRMAAHYGYISGTKGNDGDGVDCFVGFYPQSEIAYVVNQNVGGRFDEHKIILAYPDEESARRAYQDSYERGWNGLESIVSASISQLKWWLKHGDMRQPLRAENLPHEGLETMTRKTQWNSDALPYDQTIDQVLYDIRRADAGESLLLDSVSIQDIIEDSDGALAFDALVTPYAKLERKMEVLNGVMERAGQSVNPVAMQITDPFKQRGVANVAAIFELSDGQTVSIYFHNPDVTPNKMAGTDEVISWKWLLNKKDITIVVAPELGEDLNIREVARRIMKLADKNSAAFQRANGKRAETMQRIESLKEETASLEKELESAQRELEVAKQQAEDSAVANHYSQVILNNLVESFGWTVASPGQSVKKDVGGGETGGELNPTGSREVYGSFDAPRNRYLALQVGFDEIFSIDCRDRDTKEVSEEFDSRVRDWSVSTANPVADVVGETAQQVPAEIDPTGPEGYAQVMADEVLQLKWQDRLDAFFQGRIVDVRNALRELGWNDDVSKPMQSGALKKGEYELAPLFKHVGAGRNVIGINYEITGVIGFFMSDSLTLTANELAERINMGIPDGLSDPVADLTYHDDGMFTTFLPNTKAGEDAWHVMAENDGTGKVLTIHAAGVISQLRDKGYTVAERPATSMSDIADDDLLAELAQKTDEQAKISGPGSSGVINYYDASDYVVEHFLGKKQSDVMIFSMIDGGKLLQAKAAKDTKSGIPRMTEQMSAEAAAQNPDSDVSVSVFRSGDNETASKLLKAKGFTIDYTPKQEQEVMATVEDKSAIEQPLIDAYIKAWGTEAEKINAAVAAVNWDGITDNTSASAEEMKLRSAVSAAKDIIPARDALESSGIKTWDSRLANIPETPEFKAHSAAIGAYRAAQDKMLAVAKEKLSEAGIAELAALPADAPLEDVAKAIYRKHGIDVGTRSDFVAKVVTAIQEKQAGMLRDILGNTGNDASQEIFERHTGMKLAKTKRDRLVQIDEWLGITPEQRAEKDAAKDAAWQASKLEEGVKDSWGWLKSMNVRDGAGTIDGQQYLLRQVAAGYNEVGTGKKGAATIYGMKNETGLRYVNNKSFNAFLKAAQSFGGLKQALDLVGAVIPATEIKTPVQIVDSAYQFASATDEFKEWLADSVAKESYSPFVSAKAMDEASRSNGASIEWGLFGGAALDGVNADQEGTDDEVDESEIGVTFEAEDIALDSVTLDGIDQDGYVGKVSKDGDTVGRVDIGDDGKAMVFVGATGDKRVVFASGVEAMYSDGDAEMMIDALFTVDANAAEAAQVQDKNDAKDDVAKAMETLRPFMSVSQTKAVSDAMRGEEKQFFIDKMVEMAGIISAMPETYGQDGKGDAAIAYLHYFMGGMDWYITEKDMEAEQLQAFGLADLGHGGELGYISIVELVGSGAELDFNFQQKTIGQINGKKEMSEAEKSGIELADDNDRLYQEGVQAFEIGMAEFKNGGDGKASQNTEFKQFMTKYPGVGNGTRLRELGQAFRNGYEAAQREGEQPAKDDLPVQVVIAPAPSEDPQMTADRALFQSIIDNTVPDILDASYIDQLEAAYMRHIGNAEMEALFVSAVNAYTAAELAASATL